MLIFLIVLLCISVPGIDLYNIVAKNKIRNSTFIIILIAVLQLFSMLLIGFIETSFFIFQIISYITIAVTIASFAAYIGFNIYKNFWFYDWSNFKHDLMCKAKQHMFLYAFALLFILISLFQTNNLEDTLYYFEISALFRHNVFTDSYTYIIPGSYYVYGALSEGFIAQWYHLFTPIAFYLILSTCVNDLIVNIFKGKYKYLQIFALLCFVFLFTIFSSSTLISGNLYISANLLGIYLLFMKEKDYKNCALMLIVSQFFSSTGLLLSSILVISTFIYMLVYNTIKNIIKFSPYFALSLFGLPLLLLSLIGFDFGTFSDFWKYMYIAIMGMLIIVTFSANFIFKWKNIGNKFLDFNFIKTGWFSHNYMKYFVLFVGAVCMLIVTIYFQTIYFQPFVYSMIPYYLMLVLILPLFIINFIKNYRSTSNLNFIMIVNIGVTALICIFMWAFKVDNGSVWRAMMILPTICIGESTIGYLIVFGINMIIIMPVITNINWTFMKKLLIIKSNKTFIVGFSTFVTLASFVPITVIAVNPKMANFVYPTYSSNIFKNINKFEALDINKMLSLSETAINSNWTFVFDNMASAYISTPFNKNMSFDFYKSLFAENGIENVSNDGRNNPIGALGFYNSRLISSVWKNPYAVNQSLEEFSNWLNAYLVSKKWTTRQDIIVLSKHTDYYKLLPAIDALGGFVDDTLFKDITIIAKNSTILDEIRNSIIK